MRTESAIKKLATDLADNERALDRRKQKASEDPFLWEESAFIEDYNNLIGWIEGLKHAIKILQEKD